MTPRDEARERLADDFDGDNAHLVHCIEALISLSDKGALVPHGIGGHARTLLSAAAVRLSDQPRPSVSEDQGASRDHALTAGDGQGNPTLAAPDASVSVPRALLERVLVDYIQMSGQPRVDPRYGREVERLGSRIGFGAMMVSASASWANLIPGGEFCVGPCRATAKATCDQIAALFVTSPKTTDKGGE